MQIAAIFALHPSSPPSLPRAARARFHPPWTDSPRLGLCSTGRPTWRPTAPPAAINYAPLNYRQSRKISPPPLREYIHPGWMEMWKCSLLELPLAEEETSDILDYVRVSRSREGGEEGGRGEGDMKTKAKWKKMIDREDRTREWRGV